MFDVWPCSYCCQRNFLTRTVKFYYSFFSPPCGAFTSSHAFISPQPPTPSTCIHLSPATTLIMLFPLPNAKQIKFQSGGNQSDQRFFFPFSPLLPQPCSKWGIDFLTVITDRSKVRASLPNTRASDSQSIYLLDRLWAGHAECIGAAYFFSLMLINSLGKLRTIAVRLLLRFTS